jgi:hypothetical protein
VHCIYLPTRAALQVRSGAMLNMSCANRARRKSLHTINDIFSWTTLPASGPDSLQNKLTITEWALGSHRYDSCEYCAEAEWRGNVRCGRSGVLIQLAHDVASAVVAGLGMLRVGRCVSCDGSWTFHFECSAHEEGHADVCNYVCPHESLERLYRRPF